MTDQFSGSRSNYSNRLDSVIVQVTDLIEIVQENRDAHKDIYEEALAGFRLEATHALNDRIDAIVSRKIVDLHFTMPVPTDHREDYDRVLKMLVLTKDAGETYITLDENDQERFVMDNWGWKKTFEQTSVFYSKS